MKSFEIFKMFYETAKKNNKIQSNNTFWLSKKQSSWLIGTIQKENNTKDILDKSYILSDDNNFYRIKTGENVAGSYHGVSLVIIEKK